MIIMYLRVEFLPSTLYSLSFKCPMGSRLPRTCALQHLSMCGTWRGRLSLICAGLLWELTLRPLAVRVHAQVAGYATNVTLDSFFHVLR